VIMNSGRIIADGTPSEVKSVVSGRTVSFTLAQVTGSLPEVVEGLPGVANVEVRGSRVSLHSEDSDATVRALLAALPAATDIEIVSRNMDDAFMALTAKTGATK
jgi:ABC-2 type transport system ATP-binding protein